MTNPTAEALLNAPTCPWRDGGLDNGNGHAWFYQYGDIYCARCGLLGWPTLSPTETSEP